MLNCADLSINNDSASKINIANIPNINNNNVYHYTTTEGLINIINSRKLWFTNMYFLNDPKEFILGLDNTISAMIENDKNTENIPKEKIIEIKKDIIKKTCLYVLCLSKDNDNLSLWNYYTKNINNYGYNICFDFKRLIECIIKNKKNIGYNLLFGEVIYDIEEYISKIKKINNHERCKLNYDIYQYDSINNSFNKFILNEIPFLKHHSYSHEREIRIILGSVNRPANLLFRTYNGIIIPYIEIEFDLNAISGITISSGVKDNIAIEGVKYLLKSNNINFEHSNEFINKSKIPSRF